MRIVLDPAHADLSRKLAWTGLTGIALSLASLILLPTATLAQYRMPLALLLGISMLPATLATFRGQRKPTEPLEHEPILHDCRMPDLLWSIDYSSRAVTPLNHACAGLHPQAEGKHVRLATLLPPRIARQFLEGLIDVRKQNRTLCFEYLIGNEAGANHTFEARLSPAGEHGCTAIIRDISHFKKAEETVIKQQLFLQKIVDHSSDLIYLRDRHGRFLIVNNTAQAALGHDLLVQSHMAPPESEMPFAANNDEVLQNGKTVETTEKITRPDGQTRWYSVFKQPVLHDNDTYLLGIATDITAARDKPQAIAPDTDSFLRALAQALPTPFILQQQRSILFANHAACALIGKQPDEVIGADVAALCPVLGIRTSEPRMIECAGTPLQLFVLEKA